MKHDNLNIALLPTGFVDLMPEEAETEARAITSLMQLFEGYGYRRIKPPLLEFEDSLLAPGPGASLAQDTFRLMDPVSHRMMGLRSDITPQIARIVCTRLPKAVTPIRLTYANDVLRTRSGQMRTSRQFTQVGCEIIRDDSAGSYVEALMLVVLGLKELGLEGISIDLSIPRTLDALIAEMKLDADTESALRDAVSKRDADGIRAMKNKSFDVITDIMQNAGEAEAAIAKAKKAKLPKQIMAELEKLEAINNQIAQNLSDLGINDVSFTFDAFETKGFDYQSGIAFTVFSKNIRGELGRGGYYDVHFGNASQSEKAIGFTLYMDTIRPGVKYEGRDKMVAVPQDLGWDKIEDLRRSGFQICRVSDIANAPAICAYIYKNNKPEKR